MMTTNTQPAIQSAFDDLELLAQVSQLWTQADLNYVLRQVVKLAARSVGALRASLFLKDGEKLQLSNFIVGDDDFLQSDSDEVINTILTRGLAGWVLRHKRGVIIGDTLQDERWYRAPNGQHQTSSALSIPFMYDHELLGVITLVHDQPYYFTDHHLRLMTIITNQVALAIQNARAFRQVEIQRQQLESILQAIPDILLVLNSHHMIVLASDAVETLLRGGSRRSVIGLTLSELSSVDALFGQLQKSLEITDQPQREWSFEARSPVLSRDFFVHIQPRSKILSLEGISNIADDVGGYIILLNDVTALRNLSRFKDEMLRLISHDLRTPLVVITGYADLLSIDLENNTALLPYVQGIFQASERMDKMLGNMLRAEQVQTTPEELHERINLKTLVKGAYQDLFPLAERKHIQLDLDFTLETIPPIDGDAVMLQQAMGNFISNAIKYTPEEGWVQVRGYRKANSFYYEVEDNGVGIAGDDLPHLFEEYFRGDKTETHPGEGIGLGLALVRNVIREHGGDVWVTSEPGRGSVFGFWLPLPSVGFDD